MENKVGKDVEVERDDEVDEVVEEFQIDLDNLPKQNHLWVNRGLVLSCEGAGHVNHRHYINKRSIIK